MLVTRFDPFRELRELENRFMRTYTPEQRESGITSFAPSVNTREGEFAYHLEVDLPGVKKEDINVDVKDNVLTINGERNFKEEVKEEDYYKVETSFGKFTRSFNLPDSVDVENITANSDNGVLEINIPKKAKQEDVTSIKVN